MEDLCDLLFELSSPDRMNIMKSLLENQYKLSQVSKNLDITLTEASRHLQRLNDIQLITKNTGGAFMLTPYGHIALRLLSGMNLVSQKRQYFLEHDLMRLPHEFISRIDELSRATLNSDVVRVLGYVNEMFQNADNYIRIMTFAHPLPSTIPVIEDRLENGVILQRVFPEQIIPPSVEDVQVAGPCRTLPKVDVRVMMTEKEAMCSLLTNDGKTDYSSFIGKDSQFHKWCEDLFLHYWEKGKPEVI